MGQGDLDQYYSLVQPKVFFILHHCSSETKETIYEKGVWLICVVVCRMRIFVHSWTDESGKYGSSVAMCRVNFCATCDLYGNKKAEYYNDCVQRSKWHVCNS
uniref:Uncharacterized protein n=1 Tax=Arundo donax TaxID=35708 RepID=A0A0A9M8B4_ARUDO